MELNDKSVVFGPLLQRSVEIWCKSCFGEDTYFNKEERIHRFIEEALELAQSLGCTKEEIGMLTDYVFSRPKGEPNQEVGGVMITLAALCTVNDMSFHHEAIKEYSRINDPEVFLKIQAKQSRKPPSGPLPGSTKA